MLLADQFLHENFITLRNVDARVSIECAARCHATYPRCGLAPFLGEVAAGAKLALDLDEMILRAFKRWLNGVLLRMIGTETRAQESMHAFGVTLYGSGLAGDDSPSDAPSGNEIVFRHPSKRDAGHIGSNCSERDMRRGFQDQLVVDLIREHDQVVATRQIGNLLEHLPRAE